MVKQCLLVEIFIWPEQIKSLSLKEWELIIRQARASGTLAQIFYLVEGSGFKAAIPQPVMVHLTSAKRFYESLESSVFLEIDNLKKTLATVSGRLILLKGAAYIAAGFKCLKGRSLNDIDILVPEKELSNTEKSLLLTGWYNSHHDAYDDRYYRRWMHEIPPLTHMKRKTTLDVHHTILPPTARYKPDPQKLIAGAVETPIDKAFVLQPMDMVIHSCTHLFHEGEFSNGFRDLLDIRNLLNEFSESSPNFWEELVKRADELDLERPLYYGLRYSRAILGLNTPQHVMQLATKGRPSWIMTKILDALFMRALVPNHSSCRQSFHGLAMWLLYVRSHYLRMPIHLLIPHLVRKAFIGHFKSE